MTLSKITEMLSVAGVRPLRVSGSAAAYSRPTREWTRTKFRSAWMDTMKWMGVEYVEDVYVCRDIADLCVACARLWHAKANPDSGMPLAIARLDYIPDNATLNGHGMVLCITETDVVVQEPQRSKSIIESCLPERELSPAEWDSAVVRFS